ARDHFYDLTVSVAKDGTLLGLEGDIYIDAGAYSLWPTGSFMEASMASRNLTGPYRIRHLNLKTYTVATNKAPMGPYRGVARPGACFAIVRLIDEVALELGREPVDLCRQHIVSATATGPFGFGSFGSRSIVFGGGAVARSCRMLLEKIQKIGAHLLQTEVARTRVEAGAVHGLSSSVSFADIAYAANVRQEHLPAGMEPLLDATGTYEPTETGGVFAYRTHAVVVGVEPDTGVVEIL